MHSTRFTAFVAALLVCGFTHVTDLNPAVEDITVDDKFEYASNSPVDSLPGDWSQDLSPAGVPTLDAYQRISAALDKLADEDVLGDPEAAAKIEELWDQRLLELLVIHHSPAQEESADSEEFRESGERFHGASTYNQIQIPADVYSDCDFLALVLAHEAAHLCRARERCKATDPFTDGVPSMTTEGGPIDVPPNIAEFPELNWVQLHQHAYALCVHAKLHAKDIANAAELLDSLPPETPANEAELKARKESILDAARSAGEAFAHYKQLACLLAPGETLASPGVAQLEYFSDPDYQARVLVDKLDELTNEFEDCVLMELTAAGFMPDPADPLIPESKPTFPPESSPGQAKAAARSGANTVFYP